MKARELEKNSPSLDLIYNAIKEANKRNEYKIFFPHWVYFPVRQGEVWTDERSAHDEEYFSVEDHNSAIVLPKGSIYRLTGRYLTWEDDPISLKSVIEIDSL